MFHGQDPTLALKLVEAMVDEFEDYLLEDSLYRQLRVKTSSGDRMPNMSAGSLLEVLQDLRRAEEKGELTSEQARQLAELTDDFQRLVDRHAAAYREKLTRELKSQIDSWRWFLQDCRQNPSQCREEYPFEVRVRNRIELLMNAMGPWVPTDQRERLQELDGTLRDIINPSGFVLDDSMKDRFPEQRYWWLYARPEDAG